MLFPAKFPVYVQEKLFCHLNILLLSLLVDVMSDTKFSAWRFSRYNSTPVHPGRISCMNFSIPTSSTLSKTAFLCCECVGVSPSNTLTTDLAFAESELICSMLGRSMSSITAHLLLNESSYPFSFTNFSASSICFLVIGALAFM